MPRIRELSVTVVATALVLSLAATTTLLGVGVAGAAHPDDAPDLSEYADFQVNFPNPSDHYPGDQNPEGGSIEYFASGADAFRQQDAEEGVYIDRIVVHAEYEGEDWIDYSACSTDNTESFGIDRGNDNDGTEYDEGLVQRQKQVDFRDDGIDIQFYKWGDLGGDPPYMAPEDAIVASQGEGSAGGPCLTLTNEPGWYRIAAYLQGTVADNGPDQQPSDSAGEVSLELNSNNYLYVCECDSEEEAREQLGAPPNERSGGQETPEPTETDPGGDETPEPTQTDTGGDETPAPTQSGGGDATPEPTQENTGGDETAEPTQNNNGGDGGQTSQGGDDTTGGNGGDDTDRTPTPGDGPGFGALAALLALLASALIALRRD
ncbi:PGF-CTERM sorting domain-containing protein [Natronomonas salina]|uniref:PGF-CTERM sorting domain-containing protein n=1 Tax=Natronomonas salina TaxID=1710540 RepID=UPI0015B67A1D|nr:PGF-CTERM sorting domain-containing protein [Natronomonas salina]QLD89519.1 PGF-CTERM sorting domain-containing protein [Natronomonas salina]